LDLKRINMHRSIQISAVVAVAIVLLRLTAGAAPSAGHESEMGAPAALRLQYDSAMASIYGDAVSPDVANGLKMLGALDRQGMAQATYQLAAFYGNGEFVDQDLAAARRLLQRAVSAGDEDASEQLENLRAYQANHPGFPGPSTAPAMRPAPGPGAVHEQDVKAVRMMEYYSWDPPSREVIGRLGDWVEGHPGDAEAMFLLAAYQGHQAQPHASDVVPLFERAAELGYTPAKAELGYIRATGSLGLRADPTAGLAMLRDAMSQNDPAALSLMASIVISGEAGVKADLEKATGLCETATHLGMPQADCLLANAFFRAGNKAKAMEALDCP
jgi:TPR repeat protein